MTFLKSWKYFFALSHKYFGHKNYQIFLRISRNQDNILHILVWYYPHFTPVRSTLQIYKLGLNAQKKLGNKNISSWLSPYFRMARHGGAGLSSQHSETEASMLYTVSSKTAWAACRDSTFPSPQRVLKLIQEHTIKKAILHNLKVHFYKIVMLLWRRNSNLMVEKVENSFCSI